jgi:AcrR family transcriptional regulator
VATRAYHHGNLRTELLRLSERTLAERGAQGVSLRELARQAGVSHAAPRRHFADKQALLDALALEGFERLGAQLRTAVGDAGDDFTARLRAFARAYVSFATEHAALLELMFAAKHRAGAESVAVAAEAAFEAPLALVAQGQAEGAVVPGDPKEVATVAWAAIQGLASMANSGMVAGEDLDGLLDDAVERLVLGLRPR